MCSGALVLAACGESVGGPGAKPSVPGTDDRDDAPPAPSPGTDPAPGEDDGPGLRPGPWDAALSIAPNDIVEGDPVAGKKALWERGYVSCGIPYRFFGLASGQLGGFGGKPALPSRGGKNAEVPLNWTVHDDWGQGETVSFNCMQCHSGSFNGELVEGLGDAAADYTSDIGAGIPGAIKSIAGRFGALGQFIRAYDVLGPRTVMYTKGTNPADMVGVILAAHRDPETLEWLDEPWIDLAVPVVPVDTPPWWRTGKKHTHFYNSMSRGDHRGSMMFASSLCTDSVDEARQILSYMNDIHAYLRTIQAPKYPFDIDPILAEAGRSIFQENCAGCHGTYSDDPEEETYPNLVLPVTAVGTDPVVATWLNEADDFGFLDWWRRSYYGEFTDLQPESPTQGYSAPPLDGIWATAPYLHNGSVPDIETLLDSKSRPQFWKRIDYDSRNFDEETLGWPYEELGYDRASAPDAEKRLIYDTTIFAHGNQGHTYGDHLGADARRALIEYLKTF